jgi:hypothetical protein
MKTYEGVRQALHLHSFLVPYTDGVHVNSVRPANTFTSKK